MLTIRRAKVADAVSLAPRLRDADRAECFAAAGASPELLLPLQVEQGSYVWAAEDQEGIVQGLFGVDVVKANRHFGTIWMMTSDAVLQHKRDLVRLAPKWLARMHRIRPLLGNRIDARNTLHVRWLRRLGFVFLKTIPDHGAERRPFHEFARLRS